MNPNAWLWTDPCHNWKKFPIRGDTPVIFVAFYHLSEPSCLIGVVNSTLASMPCMTSPIRQLGSDK